MMILKSNSLKAVTVLAMVTFQSAAAAWEKTERPEKGRCIERLHRGQGSHTAAAFEEEQAESLRKMQEKMKERMIQNAKHANTGEIADTLIDIFGRVPEGPCDAYTMRVLVVAKKNGILSTSKDDYITMKATQILFKCINNGNLDEDIVYRIVKRYDSAILTFGMLHLKNIETREKLKMLKRFIRLENPADQMQLMETYLHDYKIIDDSFKVAEDKLNTLSEEIQRINECGMRGENLKIFTRPDELVGMMEYEAVVKLFLIHGQYARKDIFLKGDQLIAAVKRETFGDFEFWKLNLEGDAEFGYYMQPLYGLPYEFASVSNTLD